MTAVCSICGNFSVPYPYDEAGAALMYAHLKDLHGVEPSLLSFL